MPLFLRPSSRVQRSERFNDQRTELLRPLATIAAVLTLTACAADPFINDKVSETGHVSVCYHPDKSVREDVLTLVTEACAKEFVNVKPTLDYETLYQCRLFLPKEAHFSCGGKRKPDERQIRADELKARSAEEPSTPPTSPSEAPPPPADVARPSGQGSK